MREILFRGKTYDGEWVEGFLFNSQLCRIFWATAFKKEEDNIFYCEGKDVNPETVGQFTGLIDKNGKKIFEGDIVKVKITQSEDIKTYGNCKYKVGFIFYNEDFALFTCKNNFMNFINWAFNDYEIIGNIHDNPKLLKENNEQ